MNKTRWGKKQKENVCSITRVQDFMLQSSKDEKAQILMLGTNELRDLLEQKARNGE